MNRREDHAVRSRLYAKAEWHFANHLLRLGAWKLSELKEGRGFFQ